MIRRLINLWRLSNIDVPKEYSRSFVESILPKKAEIIKLKSHIDEITER